MFDLYKNFHRTLDYMKLKHQMEILKTRHSLEMSVALLPNFLKFSFSTWRYFKSVHCYVHCRGSVLLENDLFVVGYDCWDM